MSCSGSGVATGFVIGALAGAAGAAISGFGLLEANFTLFLIGSFLSGIYMSAQAFYRFAAADSASDAFRPKAISYVLAGGLLSAIIGPQLVKLTDTAMVVPFVGSYAAAAALNLIGVWMFAFPRSAAAATRGRKRRGGAGPRCCAIPISSWRSSARWSPIP